MAFRIRHMTRRWRYAQWGMIGYIALGGLMWKVHDAYRVRAHPLVLVRPLFKPPPRIRLLFTEERRCVLKHNQQLWHLLERLETAPQPIQMEKLALWANEKRGNLLSFALQWETAWHWLAWMQVVLPHVKITITETKLHNTLPVLRIQGTWYGGRTAHARIYTPNLPLVSPARAATHSTIRTNTSCF
ncbi:MAG: hypothetical protein A3J38_10455 [Gammaproteobacteria bacterium RIFCSPHIGHO2_12_FULL_45_9]|nr:MAG: hypothetical protein A3J38_10455 [Gammaproteobacteria bacterium RIFCSPHIGHO2_12_FULL_45_9]